MKKLLLVIILWQASSPFYAQNSLLSYTFDALIEKSESLIYENLDSALSYGQSALHLAQQKGEKGQVFAAYRTLGYAYEENNRFQEAQKAYEKALNLAETQLPEAEKYKIYNDWAIIHKKMGYYAIAHDYHWMTINIAEKIKNWEVAESGYNGLGTMYDMMGNEEKAIQYYQKSLDAAVKWENKEGIILTLENMAGIYLKSKNLIIGSQTIEKAYQLALELGDSNRIAAVLSLFGDIEMAKGNNDNALSKYKQSNDIFLKNGDKSRLCKSYLSLGTFYFEQKNYDEAFKNFQHCHNMKDFLYPMCGAELYQKLGKLYVYQKEYTKAIEAFRTSLMTTNALGLKDMSRENHLALADIFNHQNEHQTAYKHIVFANQLGDSLYIDAKRKSANVVLFKFDIEKRDMQIEAQKSEINQANTIRVILGVSLAFVTGLLFFTWRQMKAKLSAMQHIELLMKELHHRVKNNLQTVTSIMRLQARHITDPEVLKVLGESRSRLEAISMIHQQLYRAKDVQSVNFKLFLEGLVEKQLFTHGMNDKEIETQIVLENDYLNVDLALPLGLIINELLTNSFKYAYPSISHPKLQIEISHEKLFYADNGQGLPSQFNTQNSKSFGIQLISSLSQQLHGKFSFGNDNGMFFRLNFA